jgi:hypothetical protein
MAVGKGKKPTARQIYEKHDDPLLLHDSKQ